MDWRELWENNARKKDKNAQVSRIAASEVTDADLDRIAEYIIQKTELSPTDSLLDVCCGNGIISSRLLPYCQSVTGVDFSEEQIKNARSRQLPNSTFLQGDALQLTQIVDGPFDKIVCHFSFQYFDSRSKGYTVLKNMERLLAEDGIIFIGDIPEYTRKHLFFPWWMPRIRHEARRLLKREPMGKFWKRETLDKMSQKLGLHGEALVQPPDMLYSHYRFDYIMHKPHNKPIEKINPS